MNPKNQNPNYKNFIEIEERNSWEGNYRWKN